MVPDTLSPRGLAVLGGIAATAGLLAILVFRWLRGKTPSGESKWVADESVLVRRTALPKAVDSTLSPPAPRHARDDWPRSLPPSVLVCDGGVDLTRVPLRHGGSLWIVGHEKEDEHPTCRQGPSATGPAILSGSQRVIPRMCCSGDQRGCAREAFMPGWRATPDLVDILVPERAPSPELRAPGLQCVLLELELARWLGSLLGMVLQASRALRRMIE
jgi:hypothetical protein